MEFDLRFFRLACVFGFLGVAAGAFGAHALADRVTPERLDVFETAVRYQLLHAVVLLVVAAVARRWPGSAANWAGWLFVAGIVIFSGSLYLLVLLDVSMLGAITPLGGLALLAGWTNLGLSTFYKSGD